MRLISLHSKILRVLYFGEAEDGGRVRSDLPAPGQTCGTLAGIKEFTGASSQSGSESPYKGYRRPRIPAVADREMRCAPAFRQRSTPCPTTSMTARYRRRITRDRMRWVEAQSALAAWAAPRAACMPWPGFRAFLRGAAGDLLTCNPRASRGWRTNP